MTSLNEVTSDDKPCKECCERVGWSGLVKRAGAEVVLALGLAESDREITPEEAWRGAPRE